MTDELKQSIDIGQALDLLAAAVEQGGEYFVYSSVPVSYQSSCYAGGVPRRLVGQALSLARVSDEVLHMLDDCSIRTLYSLGRLPVQLTLGALLVFDAAQRLEDRGYAWGDALDYATDAAARYLDLVRDLPSLSCGAVTGSCTP